MGDSAFNSFKTVNENVGGSMFLFVSTNLSPFLEAISECDGFFFFLKR